MPILLRLYKISDLLPSAFDIAFKPTAAINVHGAFPKIDRWSARSCLRERTLQDCVRHRTGATPSQIDEAA